MFENYKKYRDEFKEKRLGIIERLVSEGKSEDEIIDYFLYPNISKKEPEFCILYACEDVCHSQPIEELNCFGCYCPFFKLEIWNDGKRDIVGRCAVKSKYQNVFNSPNGDYLLDCTHCWLPHKRQCVKRNLKEVLNQENI